MVGVVLIVRKTSLKLKRLQVNQSWSSLRQTAKISLFLTFYAAENTFLLNQKDFFSETNTTCPEKYLHQRLFPKRDTKVRGSSIFVSNNYSIYGILDMTFGPAEIPYILYKVTCIFFYAEIYLERSRLVPFCGKMIFCTHP